MAKNNNERAIEGAFKGATLTVKSKLKQILLMIYQNEVRTNKIEKKTSKNQ